MSMWLVTQGDNQFQVEGLSELKAMAKAGNLRAGDLIQPPGATDWLYAVEVPDLAPVLPEDEDDDEGFDLKKGAAAAAAVGVLLVGLLTVALVGVGAIVWLGQQLPSGEETIVGKGGLSYTQMIVTAEDSGLRKDPSSSAAVETPLAKDAIVELVSKRGPFYRARAASGVEGWIPVAHVIPMYQLGGADVRDEYDPLYNPDRYVEVVNARWMQLPPEKPGGDESLVTVFELMFSNESRYDMTGTVVLITVKDARGQEIEKLEIPIEGVIPTKGKTMVGTLVPADAEQLKKKKLDVPKRLVTTFTFDQEAKVNPDLQLQFTSGLEVELSSADFANANVDIAEIRAIPLEEEKPAEP